MRSILPIFQRHSLWPLCVIAIGALVLLPSLGRDGLWEPQEIAVADQARERLEPSTAPAASPESETPAEASGSETPAASPEPETQRRAPTRRARPAERRDDGRPELTRRAIAVGMRWAGTDERGARLPLALLGLLCMALAFWLGVRAASPRAGLIAALVLLSFPLFVSQSRQLTSDIGVVAGNAMVVVGLLGLAWPRPGTRYWPYAYPLAYARQWGYALDVALIAAGALLSYDAGAALWGLAVPFGAVGIAAAGSALAQLRGEPDSGSATATSAASALATAGAAASHAPGAPAGDAAGDGPGPDETPGVGRARLTAAGLALLAAGLGAALAGAGGALGAAELSSGWIAAPVVAGVIALAAAFVPTRARPRPPAEHRAHAWRLAAVASLALAVAIGALYAVLSQAFDIRDPVPGERALLGVSIIPTGDHVEALGGVWRHADDLTATFDVSFDHIAIGLFPWVGLAPIALVGLALGARSGRRAFVGQVLLAWALLSWIVGVVMARKVAPVPYSALVAVAVAIGVWLDNLIGARDQADATADSDAEARRHFGLPLRQPLVALVVLAAAIVVARDVVAFPDHAASLVSLVHKVEYPEHARLLGVDLTAWVVVFGAAFGVCMAAGLWLWACRRSGAKAAIPGAEVVGRSGVGAAIAVGVVFALFWTHGWLAQLSSRLSSKHVFSVYRELVDPGDQLGILGNQGSGPAYYAGGAFETLKNRPELIEFLRRPERVFALTPPGDLCAIHRAVKGELQYYVLDHTNERFHLLSNRLEDGERDDNPLARAIVHELPRDEIQIPLSINFDNKVELIGATVPEVVGRGDTFTVTLVFKVLAPVGGSWKIFEHFDFGAHRFQGDHAPIGGICATSFWQAGDYVVDRHQVSAGDRSFPKTTYDLWVGFFRGSFPSWKNMQVVSTGSDPRKLVTRDSENRVRIARIRLD